MQNASGPSLDRAVTDRASSGELEGSLAALDDCRDVGDDVARALEAHLVADVHPQFFEFARVVEGRAGDLDAPDFDGVEQRDRRRAARPADLHRDIGDSRRLGAGGELVGVGPPRRARGRPEALAGREVVDREHGSVDLVIEVLAILAESVAVLDGGLDPVDDRDPIGDPEAPLGEFRVPFRVGGEVVACVEDAEEKARERAFGRDRRIELAERPGGGVPGVREGVVAALDPLAVVRGERLAGHVDLAAHGEVVGVLAPEALWHRPDRADARGHVVALGPVASRRGTLVDAVFVHDLDREPVELRLADVLDSDVDGIALSVALVTPAVELGERLLAATTAGEFASNPPIELPDFVGIATGIDREHRRDMVDGIEFVERFAADPLCRAVLGREVEGVFERLQPGEQRVVGPIADDGIALDVVAVVVVSERATESFGLLACPLLTQFLDRCELGVGVLDVGVVSDRIHGVRGCHCVAFRRAPLRPFASSRPPSGTSSTTRSGIGSAQEYARTASTTADQEQKLSSRTIHSADRKTARSRV